MNKIYLITRPEHDHTTHYLSKWSEETFTLAQKHGFKIIDLLREKAVKEEFEGRIKKLSPGFIVLNGHGNEVMVSGHRDQPILVLGDNEGVISSKVVYAISCQSAKVLGKRCIEKGTLSYTGYEDDFVFVYNPERITKPLTDQTAALFLEHSQLFIESLLKGNTIGEAKSKAETKLWGNIHKLGASDSTDSDLLRFLWWDLKNFVSHGDMNTRLS